MASESSPHAQRPSTPPTYCEVAKSPPRKLTVKLKRPSIPDVFSDPTADSTALQQPTASTQDPFTEEARFCSVDTPTLTHNLPG